MASYQTVVRTQGGVKFNTDKILSAGVQVPVTPMSKVYFGYGKSNDGSTAAQAGATANSDVTAWGIQYSHDMSKRTMLYGGYMRVSNSNGATLSVLPNTGGRAAVLAGQSATGYGFGVRHTF